MNNRGRKFSEGVSVEGTTQKGAKNPFVKKPIKLPLKINKWEKEFEDEFFGTGDSENEWIDLLHNNLENLVKKYKLFHKRIKIKVRKGCIQIERMD